MPDLSYQRDGSGPPLLILHGLFGSGRNWQSHARRLAQEFDVINVDLRNHGQSFHAEEMNYPLMAGDVARLIGNLELDACRLIGHSMGGKVAMTLALDNPGLVERLLIADIAPVVYAHDHDELVDAALGLKLEAVGSRADADRELAAVIDSPPLRAFLLQNLVRDADHWRWRVNWGAIRREMHSLTGFLDLPVDWRVELPTLFIRGADSNYVDDAGLEAIGEHFPRSKIVTLAGAGHWLHAEQPAAFLDRALEFLLPDEAPL